MTVGLLKAFLLPSDWYEIFVIVITKSSVEIFLARRLLETLANILNTGYAPTRFRSSRSHSEVLWY